MRAYLLDNGRYLRVEPICFVGSSDDECNIVIEDEGVSSTHALIIQADTGYSIFDFRSTNKLFVNGRQIEQCDLRHGDEIRLGAHRITFVLSPAPPVERDGSRPTLGAVNEAIKVLAGATSRREALEKALEKLLGATSARQGAAVTWIDLPSNPDLVVARRKDSGGAGSPFTWETSRQLHDKVGSDRGILYTREAHRDPRNLGALWPTTPDEMVTAICVGLSAGGQTRGYLQLETGPGDAPLSRRDFDLTLLVGTHLTMILDSLVTPGLG